MRVMCVVCLIVLLAALCLELYYKYFFVRRCSQIDNMWYLYIPVLKRVLINQVSFLLIKVAHLI
jgi:hypothetical protein